MLETGSSSPAGLGPHLLGAVQIDIVTLLPALPVRRDGQAACRLADFVSALKHQKEGPSLEGQVIRFREWVRKNFPICFGRQKRC